MAHLLGTQSVGALAGSRQLLDGVTVGRNATVVKSIVDKYVVIEEGAQLGTDKDRDRERGFYVSDGGVTVVPKGARVTS